LSLVRPHPRLGSHLAADQQVGESRCPRLDAGGNLAGRENEINRAEPPMVDGTGGQRDFGTVGDVISESAINGSFRLVFGDDADNQHVIGREIAAVL
jgi:hypothetical protein